MPSQSDEGGNLNLLGQVIQFFWRGSGAKNFLWYLLLGGGLILLAIKIFGPTTTIAYVFAWILITLIIGLCIYLSWLAIYNPAFFYDNKTWLSHAKMLQGDKRTGLIELKEVPSTQPIIQGQIETEGKNHEDRKEIRG